MGSLPWSVFKAKLNKRFTPHNQILKDGQEFMHLHQSNGPRTMGRYVQTFVSLLNLIPWKRSMHKRWFSSMAYNLGLVTLFCKEIMSSQHVRKWWKLWSAWKTTPYTRRRKRHKFCNPPQEWILEVQHKLQVVRREAQKKNGIITHPRTKELQHKRNHKMLPKWCFNCDELGHIAKDYEKVKHDWA